MRSFITTYAVDLIFGAPLLLLAVLALLVFTSFYTKAAKWVFKLRWLYVIAFCWCVVWSLPLTANALIKGLEERYQKPNDSSLNYGQNSIVILSSGWTRTTKTGTEVRLDDKAWERLYEGVNLWKKIGGEIYIAGGHINGGPESIAQVMADVAITMGVPEDLITLETNSLSTFQNLNNLKPVIIGKNKPIYLVTSAMHMHRSVQVAKKLSIPIIPYPCDYIGVERFRWTALLPTSGVSDRLLPALHEWVGLFFYRLKDRA